MGASSGDRQILYGSILRWLLAFSGGFSDFTFQH
jgi:hypothetical protein